MTTIEAIEYLEEYNAWRRGLETMPPNPTKIGIVLDIVLTELKILLKSQDNDKE